MQPSFPLVLVACFACACGRPASAEQCEHIVARITELELKDLKITDPKEVSSRVELTKQQLRDRVMSQCTGKRITKAALHCVETAETADQIVHKCFD